MADLTPSEHLHNGDQASTVVATRPTSPNAGSIRDTLNEKDNLKKSSSTAIAVTRTASKTETTTLDADADDQVGVDPPIERLLTGRKLAFAHTGFLLAVLLFALDQTIVSTALPVLASKFDALDKLTWVVSAYFC